MTMTNLRNNMIKVAINNLKLWKDNAYTSGGATNIVYSTRTLEDLKMAKMVDDSNTLDSTIKQLKLLTNGQDMFVDTKSLAQCEYNLAKLLEE